MQSRQEELPKQPDRISETYEIQNLDLFLNLDGMPDLWKVYAQDNMVLELEAIKKFNSNQLYAAVTTKNNQGDNLLHALAKQNRIHSIKHIIEALPDQDKASALNNKNDYGNTVAYQLLALSESGQVNHLLKVLLELYPAAERFNALSKIENNNSQSILSLLIKCSMDNTDELVKIWKAFHKIYRISCGNDRSTLSFLDSFQSRSAATKLKYLAQYGGLEINSLKLAYEHYDNFNSTNIKLLIEWYRLQPVKLLQTLNNNRDVNLDYKKLGLMLSSFADQSSSKKLYESELKVQYPHIISAIQTQATPSISNIETLPKPVILQTQFEDQLAYTKPSRRRSISIESQLKHGHEFEIIVMKTEKYDLKRLRSAALASLEKSESNTNDLIKLFNRLDSVGNNILRMRLIYSPGDNENRKKHMDELFDSIKNAYTQCCVNDLTPEIINKILEDLKQKCQSIAEDAEYDHANSSMFLGLGKKSQFVTTLNKVLAVYHHERLSNMDAWTSEQSKAFDKIYQLFFKYKAKNNAFNHISFIFKCATLTVKLELIKKEYVTDPLIPKAVELALDHAENCHGQNKELIFQLYKYLDPKWTKFTVSPTIIDTIVKCLNEQAHNPVPEEKSVLINQYADLICHIKMLALQKSHRLPDNTIFAVRQQALSKLTEKYNNDTELLKKFNLMDLFIAKGLNICATYDPGNNQNRILNKDLLYLSFKRAYQSVVERNITIDMLDTVNEALQAEYASVTKNVALNHQLKSPLSFVGTKSSFAQALKTGLPEIGDDNSIPKPAKTSKFFNKISLFIQPEHEAFPLPVSELENNQFFSEEYNKVFATLIKELGRALPSKWHPYVPSVISNTNVKQTKKKSAKQELRIKNLITMDNFILCAKLSLEKDCSDVIFQTIIKELKQHLLQIIATAESDSIKSDTVKNLTKFIESHIDPKINNKTQCLDTAPKQQPNLPRVNM